MSKDLNKVRRKLETRRRQINHSVKQRERTVPMLMNRHDEEREEPDFYIPPSDKQDESKSVKKNEFFLFRVMAAVCLFLMTAILFQSQVPQAEGPRNLVKQVYEQELQFAAIADWYENQFGRPLALLPINQNIAQGDPNEQVDVAYALPVLGTISQDFEHDGRGILVETGMNAEVEAVKGGHVIAVTNNEDQSLGKTVTIEHYDGTESVYGMLDTIEVNKYDHIQAGHLIGTVSTNEEAEKGMFYFALKKDNQYINPTDVITFD
ncbi:M23 family metallopeptidase [Halalkalibacter krulwichiae]|uniref:Stage IV sporulation protein FA n=1 Tax=Halalkalibacter krulwichiae TaxID=199441 RepID=A0A1X9MDR9_9BACI|nr:M23 family metallopeptidase [Halalkalibacter krulwichiae]ARK31585.1 Stage IV sporulation protein FA [Halalkalibacter krulwichiae]